MNTPLANNIKEAKEKFDHTAVLESNSLTAGEVRLSRGSHVTVPLYLLFIGNALIFGIRKNLLQNSFYTVFAFLGTYPLAVFTGNYLFGYDKLRRIDKIARDTELSSKLYDLAMQKKEEKLI